MKRILILNLLAALSLLALFLLVDLIHISIHVISGEWWVPAFLTLAVVFFCVANRRLFQKRRPGVRFAAIGLLSVLLAVVSFCGSAITMLSFHSAIISLPANISGRVTDPLGRPVAGARVELIFFGDADFQRRQECETTSDAAGRFRLRTWHGNNHLSVRADGYASMSFDRKAHVGWSRNWNFELVPAVILSGRVVDTAGQPIPERTVTLSPMSSRRKSSSPFAFGPGYTLEPTDAEGRFTISNAAPCLQEISVGHRSYEFQQYPVNQTRIDLSPGQQPDFLEIVIHPAQDYRIEGRVVDSAGQALTNGYVATYILGGHHWFNRTDAQGAFRLQGLDGTRLLKFPVHFTGKCHGRDFDLVIDDVPLNTTNLVLAIPGRGAIHGTVREARTGKPLEKYEASVLQLRCSGSNATWEKPDIRFPYGPDGTFSISNVLAGTARLEVRADGYAPRQFEVPVQAGTVSSATFEMTAPAVLEIDATLNGIPIRVAAGLMGYPTLTWVKDGFARSDAYPAGKQRIWFLEPRYASWQRVVDVELRPGATNRVAVELGGSCEISGTVNFPDDEYAYCDVRLASKPMPDGWPSARSVYPEAGDMWFGSVPASGGEYRLRNIPPGHWYLMVGRDVRYMNRYVPARTRVVDLKEGDHLTLDFDLTRPEP